MKVWHYVLLNHFNVDSYFENFLSIMHNSKIASNCELMHIFFVGMSVRR